MKKIAEKFKLLHVGVTLIAIEVFIFVSAYFVGANYFHWITVKLMLVWVAVILSVGAAIGFFRSYIQGCRLPGTKKITLEESYIDEMTYAFGLWLQNANLPVYLSWFLFVSITLVLSFYFWFEIPFLMRVTIKILHRKINYSKKEHSKEVI